MTALCEKCNRDITRSMKFYIKEHRYCYDCYEKLRHKDKNETKKPMTIKQLYRQGMKVTDIAKLKNISTKEVYAVLNNERRK